jgi:lipopolysaccharide export system protein LptA
MRLRRVELLALVLMLPLAAAARESDRQQPIDVAARDIDATMSDDSVTRLTGDVLITQGTLRIEAGSAEMTRVGGDFQRMLLEGAPASLKQEHDDGTSMSARAARIDYDVKAETIVLTGSVVIDQAGDSMRGERVTYDMKSGRLNAAGEGSGDGRIRMTIQPRPAKPEAAAKPEGGAN